MNTLKPDPKWVELQQLVKEDIVRPCLNKKTGIISYYLTEHEKTIDWTEFSKLK